MTTMTTSLLPRLAAGIALTAIMGASYAEASGDEQELVDRAKITVEKMKNAPDFESFHTTLSRARAVVVVPQHVRAGFIIGAEGGGGVLLARTAQGGWSYPAFYALGAASFGLQIGAEVSEVVPLVMNDGALNKLLAHKVSLGGDVSIAVGLVGGGIEGRTTTNIGADIYAFARSKGAFGGVAVKGGVLNPRDESNKTYYGRAVTTRDIVIGQQVINPAADPLRDVLTAA